MRSFVLNILLWCPIGAIWSISEQGHDFFYGVCIIFCIMHIYFRLASFGWATYNFSRLRILRIRWFKIDCIYVLSIVVSFCKTFVKCLNCSDFKLCGKSILCLTVSIYDNIYILLLYGTVWKMILKRLYIMSYFSNNYPININKR